MYLDNCKITEEYEPSHVYIVEGPCVLTGKMTTVRVPGPALFKIRQGMHIQSAAPMLSADDREFLISGISGDGWDQMSGGDEEEPPDEEWIDEHKPETD